MKKLNLISGFVLLLSILFTNNLFSQACAGNQVTVSLQNITTTTTTIEFDVYVKNTGTTTMILGSVAGAVIYDAGTLPAGATGTFTAVSQPSANIPFTSHNNVGPLHTVTTRQLRWSNTPYTVANGNTVAIAANQDYKYARLRFTSSLAFTVASTNLTLYNTVTSGYTNVASAVYCNGNTNPTTLSAAASGTMVVGGPYVASFVSAPPNDNCSGAITLNGAGGPGTETGDPKPGTTVGATQSQVANCSGVDPAAANDDVWYSFTTDADGGDLSVTVVGAGGFAPVIETFSGTCASLTSLGCSNTGTITSSGLGSLVTVYFRVYDVATSLTGGGTSDRAAGTFTIDATGSAAALPVELISFTAHTNGASNLIEWVTASERNVQSHIIERSTDGISNWSEISRVAAKGNSTVETRYSLKDNAPALKSYYRLRSVDFDTKESTSSIVLVSRKSAAIAFTEVFPVPTDDFVNVRFFSNDEKQLNIEVTDVAGKLVRTIPFNAQAGENAYRLEMDVMAAGMYILTLNNGETSSEPMRIVKN
jgi:hypothetical protein